MPGDAAIEDRSALGYEPEAAPSARRSLSSKRPGGNGRFPARNDGERSGDSGVLVDGMLKLMLILLAFFVYLHGRSEPSAERATSVLHSLAARFAAVPATQGEDLLPAGEALDWSSDLRRRLIGHLPISATPLESPGILTGFDIAEAALFDSPEGSVRREQRVLLHRLAAAVESAGPSQRLILAVTAPAADTSADRGPSSIDEPLARKLGAVAAVLEAAGLSRLHLRLGLEALPSEVWRFSIRMEIADAG